MQMFVIIIACIANQIDDFLKIPSPVYGFQLNIYICCSMHATLPKVLHYHLSHSDSKTPHLSNIPNYKFLLYFPNLPEAPVCDISVGLICGWGRGRHFIQQLVL